MGKILKKRGWPRDEFIVSSKVFWGGDKPNQTGLSRKHVLEACHAAMIRLRVDYLDLYFCHRPDPETPIEETTRAMSDLVRQGKVLYWGTSEWSAEQITEAYKLLRARHGLVPPTMEQPQYNLFTRDKVEKEFAPALRRLWVSGTTIWSPLASGLLTGKYNEGNAGRHPDFDEELRLVEGKLRERRRPAKAKNRPAPRRESRRELDANLPQLGVAWCLKNPHVSTAILGASKVEQLENNLRALESRTQVNAGSAGENRSDVLGNRPA